MTDGDFERVVLPHRGRLYQYALAFTHQADEAEDLVQETLLRALRGFTTFRAEGEITAWLFAILRNQFISVYRTQTGLSQTLSLDALQNPEAVLCREPGPERRAMSTLENEALRRAVRALSPAYRTVLVLSDMRGFSYQEISDRTGLPVNTVRSRLFYARDRVRRALFAWRPHSQQRTAIFRSSKASRRTTPSPHHVPRVGGAF